MSNVFIVPSAPLFPQQFKFKRHAQVGEQKLLLTPACQLTERNMLLQNTSALLMQLITPQHNFEHNSTLTRSRKACEVSMLQKWQEAGSHPKAFFKLCTLLLE